MTQYADLHVHTNMSDGSHTPQEVLACAKENNVSYLSITDHNTLAAYTQAVWEKARQWGIRLIPGVELDVIYKGKRYHLLGYGIHTEPPSLRKACAYNAQVQEKDNLALLRRMEKAGLGVREKEYMAYKIPAGRGGWKLLNYLLDIGRTKTLREGIKYYAEYGFHSSSIPFLSLEEGLSVIKQASGVPVLAHPGEQLPYNPYAADHSDFWLALEELLKTGIQGVECIHPLHDFALEKALIALCQEKGFLISGGTDFHGHFFSKQKQTVGGQMVSRDVVRQLVDRWEDAPNFS